MLRVALHASRARPVCSLQVMPAWGMCIKHAAVFIILNGLTPAWGKRCLQHQLVHNGPLNEQNKTISSQSFRTGLADPTVCYARCLMCLRVAVWCRLQPSVPCSVFSGRRHVLVLCVVCFLWACIHATDIAAAQAHSVISAHSCCSLLVEGCLTAANTPRAPASIHAHLMYHLTAQMQLGS